MRPYPRIETARASEQDSAKQSKTYSWVETPMELHGGRHTSPHHNQDVPPLPTISPSTETSSRSTDLQRRSPNEYPPEKMANLHTLHNLPPPRGTHPAEYAQYLENPLMSPEQPQRMNGHNSAPTSPEGPSRAQERQRPINTGSDILKSPSSPRALQPDTAPFAYRPDAATGPNSPPVEMHIPGQIAHPSQQIKGGPWKHGLCDCSGDMSICCTGLLCPCILYGRTQHRLAQRSEKKDPTNMLGYETCNASCTVMSLLCACGWILAAIQHTRTRKIYNIPGGVGSDCVRSLCCCCCTLIQDEKEIKGREEQARKSSGNSAGTAYIPPETMNYAPPPR